MTTAEDVRNTIETALSSKNFDAKNSEIAFFGGSFTAIDREYMISLLSVANEYTDKFYGIRISTRPDAIDREVLEILKKYGVTSVELGAQSMDDAVLLSNNRGHNSESVREASELIKQFGFSLGLQMMTGLFGSTDKTDIYTAEEFIKLKPDTVRIYPTVLLKGTYLEELYRDNIYKPQSVEDAVRLCSKLVCRFEDEDISVIRVGLHSSDTLESNIVAGAYHPAFRELCENQIFFDKIKYILISEGFKRGAFTVKVSPTSLSKAIGQKKKNLISFKEMGYELNFLADPSLTGRQISIQEG